MAFFARTDRAFVVRDTATGELWAWGATYAGSFNSNNTVNHIPTAAGIASLSAGVASPGAVSSSALTVPDGGAFSATLSASNATSFAVSGGTDAASFQVSGATLSSKAGVTFDFDTKRAYAVTVTATGVGGSTATALTISVTNVAPGAPTRTGGSATVADGATWGGATFTASDPGGSGGSGGTLTYTLGGTDSAAFSLNGATGVLTSSPAGRVYAHSAKASYAATVTAMDASGATSSATAFTLTVMPGTPAPSAVTPSTLSVTEGDAFAASLSASDATAYSITGGADAASFEVLTLSGQPTLRSRAGVAFDFDSGVKRAYAVTVSATGVGGTTATPLTIAVANAPPPPPSVSGTAFVISGGRLAGLRLASRGSGGAPVTFALSGADAGAFDLSGASVAGATLVSRTSTAFSSAAKASYTLSVTALDVSGAVSTAVPVTVTVLTPREALEGALGGTRPLPTDLLRLATTGFVDEAPGVGAGYMATRALLRASTQVAAAGTATRNILRELLAATAGGASIPVADVSGFLATMTAVDASAGEVLAEAVAAAGGTLSLAVPTSDASGLSVVLPMDASGAAAPVFVDALNGETVTFVAPDGAGAFRATYNSGLGLWQGADSPYKVYPPGAKVRIGSQDYRLVAVGSALLAPLPPPCDGTFREDFLPNTGGTVDVHANVMQFDASSGSAAMSLSSGSDGAALRLRGVEMLSFDASGTGTLHTAFLSADTLLTPMAYSGAFLTLSDARLKTRVAPIPRAEAAAIVAGLRPVQYTWRAEAASLGVAPPGAAHGGAESGFLAQAVQAVLPEAVATNRPDGYLRVGYERVVPPLIGAVQALAEEVAAMRTDVRAAAAEADAAEAAAAAAARSMP